MFPRRPSRGRLGPVLPLTALHCGSMRLSLLPLLMVNPSASSQAQLSSAPRPQLAALRTSTSPIFRQARSFKILRPAIVAILVTPAASARSLVDSSSIRPLLRLLFLWPTRFMTEQPPRPSQDVLSP